MIYEISAKIVVGFRTRSDIFAKTRLKTVKKWGGEDAENRKTTKRV